LPILQEALSFTLDEGLRGDVYLNVGACYIDLGKSADAKRYLLEAVDHAADERRQTWAHFYLGIAYWQAGGFAQALQQFHRIEDGADEAGIGRDKIYRWLSAVYRKLGQSREAERYEKLIKE
jgi:tetratricopeptide (TPR) repeat protein